MCDLGGKERLRSCWPHYFKDTSAIIFVVDSSNQERIGEAAEEFHKLMKEEQLENVPVLILANKQDIENSLSVEKVAEELDLKSLKNHKFHIEPTKASEGDDRLYEGLEWLVENI
jgi:small GTP-binding protein